MAKYTANVVQVIMRYTDSHNVYENVYYVDNGSPANPTDMDAIYAIFNTWETTEAAALRCTTINLFEVEITAQDGPTAPRITYPVGPVIPGTNADLPLPYFVSLAVRLEGATARKSDTGRTYWIGLGNTLYTANQIDPTLRDNLVDALADLGALLIAAGKFLIILSKVIGKVSRPTNLVTHVVSTSADLILDSMNSRKDGHGI